MRMMQPKLFFCVSMETCLKSNLMLVELPSISMSTGIYAVHVRESDQEEFRDDSGIAEGTKNCLEKKKGSFSFWGLALQAVAAGVVQFQFQGVLRESALPSRQTCLQFWLQNMSVSHTFQFCENRVPHVYVFTVR